MSDIVPDDDVELTTIQATTELPNDGRRQSNVQSLPPCDHGKAAWRLLAVAFVFEALLWGFPLSFGVFQNYYSHLPRFENDPYISVVGTVASGISYIAAPLVIPLVKRYYRRRRQMIYVGWSLSLLALLAGSFAHTLSTLILTQGLLYGLGFITFYYPILSMVNEFWIERRGMAYGLMCSASGVSGAGFPFILNAMLQRFGFPTTLRAMAVGLFLLTAPLIPLLKGRFGEADVSSSGGRTDWSFLGNPLFWVYSTSNFVMGLGYFFPSLYVPSYATAIGLSSTVGALLLASMSVSQVLGQLSFGYVSDGKVSINILAITSMLVASVVAFTAWGLARGLGLLLVFSLVYGFFAAGYTAIWGRMGTAISSEPTAAFTAFGFLNSGKGIGNVLAGPIGGNLLCSVVKGGVYGARKFEPVILFTGSCMVLSAVIILVWRMTRAILYS